MTPVEHLTCHFHRLTKALCSSEARLVVTLRNPQAAVTKEPLGPLLGGLRACGISPDSFPKCSWLKSESLSRVQIEQVEWERREITVICKNLEYIIEA